MHMHTNTSRRPLRAHLVEQARVQPEGLQQQQPALGSQQLLCATAAGSGCSITLEGEFMLTCNCTFPRKHAVLFLRAFRLQGRPPRTGPLCVAGLLVRLLWGVG